MRLSFSNIAWDLPEDHLIAPVLRDSGFTRVDLAPGKYLPDPHGASPSDVLKVRRHWARLGFEIAGLQSLMFGTIGQNLFTDDGTMLARLSKIAWIGSELGSPSMTFGSPKQRDKGCLTIEKAEEIARSFFLRLGDTAYKLGITVCLEPNPAIYGCNFLTRTDETAAFVRRLDHSSIKLQLDVGAMRMNDEDAASTTWAHREEIGHIHASEPGLATLGDGDSDHVKAAQAIRMMGDGRVVTVEMAASSQEPHLNAVRRAAALAASLYGDLDHDCI